MTNKKGFLNRNQLKYLVIAAMLIDHIAWAFVPTASLLGQVMHVIGRLTGPTMAYMLAEGYHYTRNVKKYAVRLGIFAVAAVQLFRKRRHPSGIWRDLHAVPQSAGDLVLGQGKVSSFGEVAGHFWAVPAVRIR